MDNEGNTLNQDRIMLYGLFGDTSTTLQGLNDHLSPSILQQSPPCGSTVYSVSPSENTISVSPVKTGTTSHPHGLLLSDLADRSPGAGSVTAATLCNHVSFDNLRCTNLISVKGNRFCVRHINQQLTNPVTTASLPTPVKSAISQSISFVPSTFPSSVVLTLPTLSNGPRTLPGKSVRTVKVDVKSLHSAFPRTGKDLPDGMMSVRPSISSSHGNKPHIGQVLGKKVAVAGNRPTGKVVINGVTKKTGKPHAVRGPDASNSSVPQTFTTVAPSTTKNICVNVIRPSTKVTKIKQSPSPGKAKQTFSGAVVADSNSKVPQIELQKSKSKHGTHLTGSNYTSNSPASKPLQSVMIDESTLKTLLDVLNSQSNMTPQQQIALLRSLGITVLQAPVDVNMANLVQNRKQPETKQSLSKNKETKLNTNKTKGSRHRSTSVTEPVVKIRLPNEIVTASKATGDNRMHSMAENHFTKNISRNIGYSTSISSSHTTMMPNSFSGRPLETASAFPATAKTINQKRMSESSTNLSTEPFTTIDTPQTPTTCDTIENVGATDNSNRKNVPRMKEKSTALRKKSVKAKQDQVGPTTLEILPNAYPELLDVPESSQNLQQFAVSYNDVLLENHNLFNQDLCDLELYLNEGTRSETPKTSNSELLKRHLKRKRLKEKMKDCTEGLSTVKSFQFYKKLYDMKKLLLDLKSNQSGRTGELSHPEQILQGLVGKSDLHPELEDLRDEDDSWIEDNADLLDAEMKKEPQVTYTLSTKRRKIEYEERKKNLRKEKENLELLYQSYIHHPSHLSRILDLMLSEFSTSGKVTENTDQRCQLSNNNGWTCSSPALPYTLYCKQHIWHCQNQCLYKLDHNMKTVADVSPEPSVKKVRKRTKLLPLIKRYKKKKRRKVQGEGEGAAVVREDGEIAEPEGLQSKVQVHSTPIRDPSSSRGHDLQHARQRISSSSSYLFEPERKMQATHEDVKSLDTSEEDLNLTGQEIMMSGVFDKLPEDLNDFDLFTTDKGAEELERALLLAATSPTFESEKNESSSGDENRTSKSTHKSADMTPGTHCVDVVDAPRTSNTKEAPPSIESFKQSQCVHYTFGSNFVVNSKSQVSEAGQERGSIKAEDQDITPPLISAEELQDIEGVLESLQKDEDDINSPLLPSSPAVDEYTSMLARQLSQEVESESKRLSNTSRLVQSPKPSQTSPANPTNSVCLSASGDEKTILALSRSSSLPMSTSKTMNLLVSANSLPQGESPSSETDTAPATCPKSSNPPERFTSSNHNHQVTTAENLAKLQGADFLDPLGLDVILPSLHDKSQLLQHHQASLAKSLKQNSTANILSKDMKTTGTSTNSRKTTVKKGLRKANQAPSSNMTPNPTRTPFRKLPQQSPTLMSNQVLPLTLMQSPSQNGNIIKVIVPPGTMVNGSGTNSAGQQNMLLIPVNALVRPEMMSPPSNHNCPVSVPATSNKNPLNQTPKTQLSSIQAGQQFLIVNNSTASAQPHLTLLQKPNNMPGNPQTMLISPNSKGGQNLKNLGSQSAATQTVQKSTNQKTPKQVLCNIKPNMNVYVNQTLNKFLAQSKLSSATLAAGSSAASKATNTTNTMSGTNSSPRLPGSAFGKFSAIPADVHKIHKTHAKKQAKARFDPVTKKYVPGAIKPPVDSQTAKPTAIPITDPQIKEKFDASALSSIQNKVLQINSVLSSLNSASKHTGISNTKQTSQANPLTSGKKNQKFIKSVTVPIASSSTPTPAPKATPPRTKLSISKSKPGLAPLAPSPAEANKRDMEMTATSQLEISQAGLSDVTSCGLPNGKSSSSTVEGVQGSSVEKAGQPVPCPTSEQSEDSISTTGAKSSVASTSAGTVHWNQTTTAGPEVTPGITVPVYITAGKWPSDLPLNGQLSRSSIPIIIPPHKISPNYQLPQRVVLGSIGSLGILSSRNDSSTQHPPTITISTYPQLAKSQNSEKSTADAPRTPEKPPNVAPEPHCDTSVTTVVGTKMSAKLSPFSKNSFPERFATIDQQGILHVYKPGVTSSMTSSTSSAKTNPAYVLSVRSPPILSSSSPKMSTESTTNGVKSPTSGLTFPPTTSPVMQPASSCPQGLDQNGNHKLLLFSGETKLARKKCGRKASHDTILHDPLMYDPTTLEGVKGDKE